MENFITGMADSKQVKTGGSLFESKSLVASVCPRPYDNARARALTQIVRKIYFERMAGNLEF